MLENNVDSEPGDLEGVSADRIRELPDSKIEELADSVKGSLRECPECGVVTAFIGTPTYNDTSECHNCGFEAGWL